MKVFAFDPRAHAELYRSQDFVHIRGGLTQEFLASVEEYARSLEDHLLESFAIRGKKEQALYEFPSDVHIEELYEVVAGLCGLDPANMTLSERHLQAYDPGADPDPPAHKDRFPSQVSVGLSIAIPERSRLVLYPYSHREVNPFNTSAGLRRHLQPEELPEVVLAGAREVEIDDRRGDVVAFPGSSTWHLRRNAARAVNLYLKFNDFGCDPLGEDPHTEAIHAASLAALDAANGGPKSLVPILSRRFDTVSATYTRGSSTETLEARLFGEEPFGITPQQFAVLRSADRTRTLDQLAREVADGDDGAATRGEILRLVELGALDLAPPTQRGSSPDSVRSICGGAALNPSA